MFQTLTRLVDVALAHASALEDQETNWFALRYVIGQHNQLAEIVAEVLNPDEVGFRRIEGPWPLCSGTNHQWEEQVEHVQQALEQMKKWLDSKSCQPTRIIVNRPNPTVLCVPRESIQTER